MGGPRSAQRTKNKNQFKLNKVLIVEYSQFQQANSNPKKKSSRFKGLCSEYGQVNRKHAIIRWQENNTSRKEIHLI